MLPPECLPLLANMKKIFHDILDSTCKQQVIQANSDVSEAQALLSFHRVTLPFGSPKPNIGKQVGATQTSTVWRVKTKLAQVHTGPEQTGTYGLACYIPVPTARQSLTSSVVR